MERLHCLAEAVGTEPERDLDHHVAVGESEQGSSFSIQSLDTRVEICSINETTASQLHFIKLHFEHMFHG